MKNFSYKTKLSYSIECQTLTAGYQTYIRKLIENAKKSSTNKTRSSKKEDISYQSKLIEFEEKTKSHKCENKC